MKIKELPIIPSRRDHLQYFATLYLKSLFMHNLLFKEDFIYFGGAGEPTFC